MIPFFNRMFPSTNLQDLNLDWICRRIMELSKGIIAPWINPDNDNWMVYDTETEQFIDSGVSAAGVKETETVLRNNWFGARFLILGDSWARGWDGSQSVTPWCDTMIAELGATAEYVRQSGGGLTTAGAEASTFPGETLVQALDHFSDAEFDCIVLQTGWNDLTNADTTPAAIESAVAAFVSKCRADHSKAAVRVIPTYPPYQIPTDKYAKAQALVDACLNNGVAVAPSFNWFNYGRAYRGDGSHLNAAGYTKMGKLAASWLNGGDGKVYGPSQMLTIVNGVATNETVYQTALGETESVNQATSQLYIRCRGASVSLSYRARVLTQETSGTFTVVTGLPLPDVIPLDSVVLFIGNNDSTKRLPRASISASGDLAIALDGDAYNTIVQVTVGYNTTGIFQH